MSTPETPAEERPGLCRVKLSGFQGPLDVLLHLVRTDELDVTTIAILEVARQCDEYLALLSGRDLETAGENLVLASALVHLKSRRLLPPTGVGEEAGTDEFEDPALRSAAWTEGVRRAAEELQEREAQMELVFTRPAECVAEFAGEEWIEADLYSLLSAFQAILKRRGTETPAARITRDRMSLVERIDWLLEALNREKRLGFRALFADIGDRMSCILTFLALLEVIRLRLIRAFESHDKEDILIVLVEETAAPPPSEGELTADA